MTVKEYEGHRIDIKRGDRLLFPDSDFCKRDLIDYYSRIAPLLLPHLQGRPLILRRFPGGIDKAGFLQRSIPDYYPDWIERILVSTSRGDQEMVNANSVGALAYLANQGAVELHMRLSRQPDLDYPDQMILDLEPAARQNFASVRQAAEDIHDLCSELKLPAFLKSTGSSGLQVVIPIEPEYSFDVVRNFARNLAQVVVNRYPQRYTLEQRSNKRAGKLYLDVFRNGRDQTVIAPYSIRALPGAPIATPLAWDEIANQAFDPTWYQPQSIFRRLALRTEPWADFQDRRIRLSDHLDQLPRVA